MNLEKFSTKLMNNRVFITYIGIILLVQVILQYNLLLLYVKTGEFIVNPKSVIISLSIWIACYIFNFIAMLFVDDKRNVLKLSMLQCIIFVAIIIDLILAF